MKQPPEIVGQACPGGLQFVRAGGAGDGLQGGLAQLVLQFAAGLLLYWITNNLLSIAQQQWMYRKFPQLKAVPAK